MTPSDAAYFASKALSKSAIDLLLECPALYKAWLDDTAEEPTSDALGFGSLVHMLTLQPEAFARHYAVTDLNLSTRAGKEWKASLAPDVTICKMADNEKALLMAEAVREHPQAQCLFREYAAERPVFWERDGIPCKAKPDMISIVFGNRYCADLKTTESANPEAIRRSIVKYGYHRQAAWYLAGLEATGQPCKAFIFIFVEKTYPHLVTMCQLDDAALRKGREECGRALGILRECRETGVYPCYTRDILTLSLPSWAA